MQALVLNSGSSSLKFRLSAAPSDESGAVMAPATSLVAGSVKGIGGRAALQMKAGDASLSTETGTVPDHTQAIRWVFEKLPVSAAEVEAVAHRVVHGGDRFSRPVRIDDEVIREIDAQI
jgi:acetate kinase